MEILKKLTENNFNEVAKLIESNQIPEELMTGNIKNQLKKFKHGYSTPASINLALKHQKALKYGYKQSVKFGDHEFCECCNIRVQNEDISICEKVQPSQKDQNSYASTIEEFKFTSDVAFFLTFIKSCIILTLLNSLIHSIFNLLSSELFGKTCENMIICQKIVWNTFSMPNKLGQQQWIQIVDILNLVGIIISILFFSYNRRRQYRLHAMIDRNNQSQNDYTIFVSNIPLLQFPKKGEHLKSGGGLEFFYRKHLEEFFNGLITEWLKSQDQWQQKKDKVGLQLQELMRKNNGQLRSNEIVKSVSLCYNLSRLEVLEDIKAGLVDTYENQQDEGTSLLVNQQGETLYSQRFSSIPQRIGFLNDCELVLNGQYARDSSFLFSVTHFVGQAFVTFQYEHFKQFIERLSIQDPTSLYYNGNFLKIEDACHPTDVYWQNMKVADKYRSRKTLSSYLFLGMVLVFSFIIMLSLQLLKQSSSQSETGDIITLVRSYSLTVAIAVMILVVNYVLEYLALTLTAAEKRKTRMDFSSSVLVKTFLAELINTIMLYFFVALLLRNEQLQSKLMGSTGLVFQITTLIAVTGIIHVLKSIIYPQDLICRLKRWWKYRKCQDSVQKKFQITLNKEYEHLQFDFATRYSHYLITVYVAFFYSYLVPFAIPIVCVLFFLQYWVDKFTILRRSSIRYHFGFNLTKQTSKLFESSILVLALGNLIFSYYAHNFNFTVFNLVSFGIAALFTLLIWTSPKGIQRIVFGEYEYNEKLTYDDCLREGKFEATYWTQNPASFLIEQEKVTGRRKAVNPAFNRKSVQGDMFISSIHD